MRIRASKSSSQGWSRPLTSNFDRSGKAKPLRLAIFGVAGHNRGDDAIALSLIEGFGARRSDIRFVTPVLKPGALEGRAGVAPFVLNRRSPLGLARLALEIARADAVILGGGSVIQDAFGGGRVKGILGYAWMTAFFCRLLGRPLFTAPIGVDAITTPKALTAAREALAIPRRITVRDQLSAQVLGRIMGDCPHGSLQVVCDPVFGWRLDDAAIEAAGLVGERPIVLSPAFEGRNEDEIARLFAAIAASMIDEGRPVCIIAMDGREHEDGGKIGRIRDLLKEEHRPRVTLARPESAEEAARLIRGAAGVVAMRLHALILGYGYAPLFCLSRTTKTDALMAEYDIPGVRIGGDATESPVPLVGVAMRDDARVARHGEMKGKLRAKLDEYYAATLRDIEECRRA
jgi:polysaccharide pyruvyl transferase WcaK-like protein